MNEEIIAKIRLLKRSGKFYLHILTGDCNDYFVEIPEPKAKGISIENDLIIELLPTK